MSRSALVVGINQYPHFNSLRLPAIDAEAIAKVLETQGEFHVRRLHEANDSVTVAPDKQVNLTDLENALSEFFTPASEQLPDVALFYFAGHGVLKQCGVLNDAYLATSDTNLTNAWGLSLDWLRRLLQASPIRNKIIWLDCCHSGALNFEQHSFNSVGDNICFIAASLAHERAYEDIAGDHGILTKVLLQGLDCTHKERVTSLQLSDFIQAKLRTETQTPTAFNLGKVIDLTFNRKQATETIAPPTDAPCPYKGLFYFDCNETDAQNFYGRETLISELIGNIHKNNFIAVLGASGSGKSSLVRAGLLYRLQTGQHINGSEQWQHLIFTPTEQPLESLAWAFVDKSTSQIEQASQLQQALDLLKTDNGFQILIKAAKTKLIICVDQFEELFTLCRDEQQRERFLDLLLNALAMPREQYALIITLRADFYMRCIEREYFGLAKLLQNHAVPVTPLNETELRAAIIEPAKKFNVPIEAALIEQLLKDSQQAVGYLPLLQDVLQTLWTQGLTLSNYATVGGLVGALEQRANQVYQGFNPEQQPVAQAVFLSLVKLGEGTQDTRRRAFKSELHSQRCSEALLNEVILELATQRLIVTSAIQARDVLQRTQETVLDIAHEALIQHWQSLRQWLTDNREFKAWHDRLKQAEQEWRDGGQHDDLLLPNIKALEAREKLSTHGDELNAVLIEFIEHSAAAQTAKTAEKERMKQIAEQQKNLALEVINQFTYDIPEALANIPNTAKITAAILQYNIQSLEKIYALNPEDKNTQREQGSNYSRVGNLYLNLLGDTQQALDFYQKSLNIAQKIAEQDPNNPAAQRDLSVSFDKLGNIYLTLNQSAQALTHYQNALTIRQKIAEQAPNNPAAQRDLSVSFDKLGNIYLTSNQSVQALTHYQNALTIRQKIAEQDPNNPAAQRDLSVSFNKLGDIYLTLNQSAQALTHCQNALAIKQALAEKVPNNPAAQRGLSVSFDRLGDIYLTLNQCTQALTHYQNALTIRQKIAEQDPNNHAAQRDLFASYGKLGTLHQQLNQTALALEFFQKALPIAEKLAEGDKLNYQAQQDLKAVQEAINNVNKQQ